MIKLALSLAVLSHVDSVLPTTREFWRRYVGLPEPIVLDPRNLSEILKPGAN